MKQYHILNSFTGSQTGSDECRFEAGTVAMLSDELAAIVVAEGFAKPVDKSAATPANEPEEPISTTAETRDTKVTGPEEIKPAGKKKR